MALNTLPAYTIQPTYLRVVAGRVEDDPDLPMIGIQAHDRRGQFTLPLSATDAATMAKLLMMLANDVRERDGLPAYEL
ncbi:hypothetical protein [Mycolicibacterium hippocampi]|uniref:Uncharacterized protein n=1 Tax=Mycolicibacterium hippocampi TaxID=659824 RepID=A0A7I9ZR23_9MYCO|nr:hypothetical protein [Mycolicibacterium hippocampi]GFH03146.1 hypothetical protein MHIP_36290 [Mycolicibacterium hippocampi]